MADLAGDGHAGAAAGSLTDRRTADADGLTTRFRELTRFGWQPFWAFCIGVAVNVPLGFLLSNVAFRDFWLAIR